MASERVAQHRPGCAEPGAHHNGRVTDEPVDYVLANGEDLHAGNPRSFFIPSRAERDRLQPGDLAKLLFKVTNPRPGLPDAERMWVRVTGRDAHGYEGVLTNTPAAITTISRGGAVRFGSEHVISVLEDWPLLEKKVLVSRRSHERDLRPRWVYREQPEDDGDSGWRALVGDETERELADPANIVVQQLGFLLDRWPELRTVFGTDPANGDWAWDERSARYAPAPR